MASTEDRRKYVVERFILYSAMSHKPLAWENADDVTVVEAMPAFWAVLLAGRDTAGMVNMILYMEDYKISHPVTKIHGEWRMFQGNFLCLPFLTNTTELQQGDLLVLPFDGGMPQICCEAFPPI